MSSLIIGVVFDAVGSILLAFEVRKGVHVGVHIGVIAIGTSAIVLELIL